MCWCFTLSNFKSVGAKDKKPRDVQSSWCELEKDMKRNCTERSQFQLEWVSIFSSCACTGFYEYDEDFYFTVHTRKKDLLSQIFLLSLLTGGTITSVPFTSLRWLKSLTMNHSLLETHSDIVRHKSISFSNYIILYTKLLRKIHIGIDTGWIRNQNATFSTENSISKSYFSFVFHPRYG